jgi:hypothetical protein
MTPAHRPIGFLEDDDYYDDDPQIIPTLTVDERIQRAPEDTGLVLPNGDRIVRVYCQPHPIGFLARIEDHEAGVDYYYDVLRQ